MGDCGGKKVSVRHCSFFSLFPNSMPFPSVPVLPHCGFMGSNTGVHFPVFVLKTVSSAFGLVKFMSFSLGDGGELEAKPVTPYVLHILSLSMITSYTSSKHNNQKACFHPSLVFDIGIVAATEQHTACHSATS